MANGSHEKLIRITLDSGGLPVPDIDPIRIRKGKQKIRWCAEFEFSIEIEGYPDVKYGPGGPDCPYRALTGFFDQVGSYKYTIRANGQENDPVIDVEP